MTKFMDRSFSVPMPGEAAKQWPACGDERPSPLLSAVLYCTLEFGHPGRHEHRADEIVIFWERNDERWIWRNGKREAA